MGSLLYLGRGWTCRLALRGFVEMWCSWSIPPEYLYWSVSLLHVVDCFCFCNKKKKYYYMYKLFYNIFTKCWCDQHFIGFHLYPSLISIFHLPIVNHSYHSLTRASMSTKSAFHTNSPCTIPIAWVKPIT